MKIVWNSLSLNTMETLILAAMTPNVLVQMMAVELKMVMRPVWMTHFHTVTALPFLVTGFLKVTTLEIDLQVWLFFHECIHKHCSWLYS